MVEILLNHGADLSTVTDSGVTALHMASYGGNLSVTRLLLEAGADVRATTINGAAPLHVAAELGHSEIITTLIKAGADPNTRQPSNGETPLYLSAWKGHIDAVRVLLRANANALLPQTNALLPQTRVLDKGLTPLDIATMEGHVGVVRELVRQLGAGGPLGESALCASGSPKTARILVEAGVNTSARVRIVTKCGVEAHDTTILNFTNRRLREKKVFGEDATEDQLNGLKGIRRLILQVEAVHAVSWLWYTKPPLVVRAADGTRKRKVASTPFRTMLPILRRRTALPGVLFGPAFR